ncbi:MAG TPA: c-type cytochrome [Gemmataceae bacterium]|jgi:mono/diheme cytochrome c family protein|nr:c-type cytochrome [Gemmataceae bacterium]
MSRSFRFPAALALIVVGSLSLVGCDDTYSSFIQYALRTDPLAVASGDKFGEERYEPDSPGQLPLYSMKDINLPSNPMYPMRAKLVPTALVDPTTVSTKQRAIVKKSLDEWFGTPASPKAADANPSLKLDPETLAAGSKLFRVHCMHCHGVSGDGHGVTAKWVVPHPRDFRQMLFKFESVDQGTEDLPPRREDLHRTLTHGVEATAMPAFNLLPSKDIDALISYVMHLSIRGKVEYDTFRNLFVYEGNKAELNDIDEEDIPDKMLVFRNLAYKSWEKAQKKPIVPRPFPFDESNLEQMKASVQRGYVLFTGDAAKNPLAKEVNCVACHKNFGREATFRWDAWGTLVRPNNLVDGIYRGGRRTEDLYNRIHSGINGSGMLRFGQLEQKSPTVVWDLVNFVRALPYPAMREKYGIEIK